MLRRGRRRTVLRRRHRRERRDQAHGRRAGVCGHRGVRRSTCRYEGTTPLSSFSASRVATAACDRPASASTCASSSIEAMTIPSSASLATTTAPATWHVAADSRPTRRLAPPSSSSSTDAPRRSSSAALRDSTKCELRRRHKLAYAMSASGQASALSWSPSRQRYESGRTPNRRHGG